VTLSLAIQIAASITAGASSWAYGNKRTSGPLLGIISQVPWWALMVHDGLWGLLPANVLFAGMHIRNLIKWKKEAALGTTD
jgi:hypothetical protein